MNCTSKPVSGWLLGFVLSASVLLLTGCDLKLTVIFNPGDTVVLETDVSVSKKDVSVDSCQEALDRVNEKAGTWRLISDNSTADTIRCVYRGDSKDLTEMIARNDSTSGFTHKNGEFVIVNAKKPDGPSGDDPFSDINLMLSMLQNAAKHENSKGSVALGFTFPGPVKESNVGKIEGNSVFFDEDSLDQLSNPDLRIVASDGTNVTETERAYFPLWGYVESMGLPVWLKDTWLFVAAGVIALAGFAFFVRSKSKKHLAEELIEAPTEL